MDKGFNRGDKSINVTRWFAEWMETKPRIRYRKDSSLIKTLVKIFRYDDEDSLKYPLIAIFILLSFMITFCGMAIYDNTEDILRAAPWIFLGFAGITATAIANEDIGDMED